MTSLIVDSTWESIKFNIDKDVASILTVIQEAIDNDNTMDSEFMTKISSQFDKLKLDFIQSLGLLLPYFILPTLNLNPIQSNLIR